MGAHNVGVPDMISVRYARHPSGLYCALSDDLEGLQVFGADIDEVREDLLEIAAALVKERFGVETGYTWSDESAPAGFVPLDRMAREDMRA